MSKTTEGPSYRIPLPEHLRHHLAAGHELPRSDYVRAAKESLAKERVRIKALQEHGINEVTGMDVAGALTGITDVIMVQLAERAFEKAGAPDQWWEEVGVFALGSYGRGELAPYSDIDLMTLYAGRGTGPEWVSKGGKELETLLWDVGFKVGGSCRGVAELDKIISDDFVTATAVLEQRPVIAGDFVCEELRRLREKFRKKRANAFMRYKVEEMQGRRQSAGRNLFLLQPNLKSNPGCLRDIQFLRNASYIISGSRNLHALRDLDVIEWDDIQQLFAANDHLVGVRSMLHFHHGHAQDELRLTDQLWLADQLGYSRGGRLLAVEHMMRLHYEKTLHVHQMVDITVNRMRGLGYVGRRRILIKSRRRMDDDFSSIDGRVYLANRDFWQYPDAPLRLMKMFRLAQRRGLRIGLELQREIKYRAHILHPEQVRQNHEIARIFLEIIGDLGKVRNILEDMHWSGLLGAYMPEFGRLTCHMQFNSYHQYTVDEHTLIALGMIDKVFTGEVPGVANMQQILQKLDRPDLLMLSLLLHDVGKFMGSGHVKRGAMMVRMIADRMGLDEIEEDLVHFLVDQHVTLSDATRNRNIHDPSFLADLASDMGDGYRLDLLYCLTFADAKAVGVGVFTGWQEALLAELHEACRNEIRWMTGQGAVSRPQRVRDELHALGIAKEDAASFLDQMGESYAYQVQTHEVARHLELLKTAKAEGYALKHEVQGDAITVDMASLDRPRLLSEVAAALTGNGFEVVEARTWCTDKGMVLHSHRLQSTIPTAAADPTTWERLDRDLRKVVAKEADPADFIARRRSRITTDGPVDSGFHEIDVRIDQDSALSATVIDVRVKDYPGLLYDLCRIIADAGVEIEYASIATFGDVARDAFYVTQDSQKLEGRVALKLRNALRDHLQAEEDKPDQGTGVLRY